MKRFFRAATFCMVLFLCNSLQLQAQGITETSRKSPFFSAEVGMGMNLLKGYGQMLSPQGIYYRDNYNPAWSGYVQMNYVFKSRDMLGLRYAAYAIQGNYKLDNGMRMAENIQYQYVAPQYGYQMPVSRRMTFLLTAGAGYLNYRNDGLMENREVKTISHMLGVNGGLSVDWRLAQGFSLGCRLDALYSFFGDKLHNTVDGKATFEQVNRWNAIRIAQLDFGIYVRFHL